MLSLAQAWSIPAASLATHAADSHTQGIADELSGHTRHPRPTNHFASIQIDDGCQVHLSSAGTDVGDIADAADGRRGWIEPPVQHIGGHRQPAFAMTRNFYLLLRCEKNLR